MKDSIHHQVLQIEKLLKIKKESFWIKRGEKNVLKYFKKVQNIPAYKKFLQQELHKIPQIKTIRDFKNLPTPLKYFAEKLKIPFVYGVTKEEGVDYIKENIRVISASKFLTGLF